MAQDAVGLKSKLPLIVYVSFLAYTLLVTRKGLGTLDYSLFGNCNQVSLYLVIAFQLYVGCLVVKAEAGRAKGVSAWLLWLALCCALIIGMHAAVVHTLASCLLAANMLLQFSSLLVCYGVMSRQPSFERLPHALLGVMLTYAVVATTATILHSPTLGSGLTYHVDAVDRLSVLFDQPNHLGNMLAFGVVFCFALFCSHPRFYVRLFLWFLLVALLHALLMTFSRGAWLACSVGLLISLIYLYNRISLPRLSLSLLLLMIALVSSMALSFHFDDIGNRVAMTSPSSDASVGHRLAVFKGAISMIRDHWLTGVGIGRFEVAFEDYKSKDIEKQHYSSAVNSYLTLAALAGIPNFLAYSLMLICASTLASRIRARTQVEAGYKVGMLCGVYSMFVFAMTTDTLGSVYAAMLTGSVLGGLASPESTSPQVLDRAPIEVSDVAE